MQGDKSAIDIKNIQLTLHNKSVTVIDADTILVPNPQNHPGGGGVFIKALQKGAIDGCDALQNYHSLSSDAMEPGSVMTVKSGGGASRHLTHAASVCEFSNGSTHNFRLVVLSVMSALEDMHQKNLSSINIPLMGTGQLGWLDNEQSMRAILIAVDRFTKEHPNAKMHINICVPNKETVLEAKAIFNKIDGYRDVSDQEILDERGNKVPPAADITTYRSCDVLSGHVGRRIPKYTGLATASSPFTQPNAQVNSPVVQHNTPDGRGLET